MSAGTLLYDARRLEPVLERMARASYCLIPDPEKLVVVGILRRGAPLADRVCRHLVRLYGVASVARLDLKIKRYADDLTLLHPETQLTESAQDAALDLAGRSVLVVDDVLYQGHSLLRALSYLTGRGAATVRSALLVDRHCATLPVKADVAGLRLEVAPDQIVEVCVPPYEDEFAIRIGATGAAAP